MWGLGSFATLVLSAIGGRTPASLALATTLVNMRYFLASLLILFSLVELRGQTFNKIEIIAQQHDEPPKGSERPLHQLTFVLNDGNLTLSNYKISNSSVSTNSVSISESLVDSLAELLNSRQTTFVIRRTVAGEQLSPIVLDLDSMNFCIDNAYMRKHTISTGGLSIKIKVKNENSELLNFEFNSSKPDDFDYQTFLTLYPILQNNLPRDLPGSYLFDDIFLMQKVSEYLEQITCEGYYYREFVNEHPERTPQQNRTREGWNFQEYLKSKSGS